MNKEGHCKPRQPRGFPAPGHSWIPGTRNRPTYPVNGMSPASDASVRPERLKDNLSGERIHLTTFRGQGTPPAIPEPNDRHNEIEWGTPHQRQHNHNHNKPLNEINTQTQTTRNRRTTQNNQERDNPRNENELEISKDKNGDTTEDTTNQRKKRKKKKKKRNKHTRTSLKIASLNLNGKGTLANDGEDNKWLHLNQIMHEEKIGILAIQEAHLTPEFIEQLKHLFNRRLHIEWSQGPDQNKGGIAFIMNKELTSTEKIRIDEIIPGTAAMLTIPWNNKKN